MIIVELLMLVGGICTAATSKLPSWLVGGSQYTAEGIKVRLLGLWIAIPFPAALITGLLLGILLGKEAEGYATLIEILIIFVVAVGTVIAFRFIRKPTIANDNTGSPIAGEDAKIEVVIAKKSQGALIYSIIGGLGFTAIITSPLAFIYANQALWLIKNHHVGEQYRRNANLARILAMITFVFFACIAWCLISLAFGRSR